MAATAPPGGNLPSMQIAGTNNESFHVFRHAGKLVDRRWLIMDGYVLQLAASPPER